MKKIDEIFELIRGTKPSVLSIAVPEDTEIMLALKSAKQKQIIKPILVGNEEKILEIGKKIDFDFKGTKIINKETMEEAAECAVKLVSKGDADFIMKGLLDTSIILKAILNKEWGLRTNNILSHVMVYDVNNYHKVLLMSDGGVNVAPSCDTKVKILKNSIEVARALKIENIKVACISAKEKVDKNIESTIDARFLQEESQKGIFGDDVVVEGPLSFDVAISKKAAETKGFKSEVAGDADVLIVPSIEVGNVLGKTLTFAAPDTNLAGVVMGAKTPIVLVSRSDSHESKLYSIALGALVSRK